MRHSISNNPFRTVLWIAVVAFCIPLNLNAQISFEKSDNYLHTADFRSGFPVGISDLNGNLLDDVFRLDRARKLSVDMQMEKGQFRNAVNGLHFNNEVQWNIVGGDLDNNGLADIMCSGVFKGIQLFRQTAPGVFEVENLPGIPDFFSQAANLIDINNDGFLDLFVCDDHGESKIFGNDGAGNFSLRDEWIDMSTVPQSDNSGNYGSVWSDVSGNGKMDLYLSKCKGSVLDHTDPRRINALFINTGDNTFIEAAAEYGLADGGQSWASDFADINNNGLMDLFVINHDRPSVLYLNTGGGNFQPITVEAGIPDLGSGEIQVLFADFDNDGFVDLIVTGNRSYLFHNNGDGTFSLVEDAFDFRDINSLSIGDLNDDGFLDIYAGYGNSLIHPGDIDDAVWINSGNHRRHLRFRMRGIQSNRDGVGAIVKVYSSLGIQTREVRAGESYGIQRSNIVHFGMADLTEADSVVITWPSGTKEVYEQVATGKKYLATEGVCIRPPADISYEGNLWLCENPEIVLSAPPGYNYTWSTGSSDRSIVAVEIGSYYFDAVDDEGCITPSNPVYVKEEGNFLPVFEGVISDAKICSGEQLELRVKSDGNVVWSNGVEGLSLAVTEAGEYFATVSNACGEYYSDTVYVKELHPALPVLNIDNVYTQSEVVLRAEGDEIKWYTDDSEPIPSHIGEEWQVTLEPGLNTFYVANASHFPDPLKKVGSSNFEGDSKYPANHINGGLIFDVYESVRLKSLKLYSDFDGPRIIQVLDKDGILIDEDMIYLENASQGQYVNLDLLLPEGESHLLTTDADFNLQQTGFRSPRLFRSDKNTAFPYELKEKVSINTSTLGTQFYYYFYDWEVKGLGLDCESERISFTVDYDTTTEARIPIGGIGSEFILYPNPTATVLELHPTGNCTSLNNIRLFDLSGKSYSIGRVTSTDQRFRIDVEGLPAGTYFLSVEACNQPLEFTFLKVN